MGLFGIAVLLIEDEDKVAEAVAASLRAAQPPGWQVNYHIKRLKTLREGKKFIAAGGWDVILLDTGLPNGRGIEAFRQCVTGAGAPIIVLSENVDMETVQQMLREGAARCFDKALALNNPVWLNYSIVAVMEHWRLTRQVDMMQEELVGKLRNLITACSACQRWKDPGSGQYVKPGDFLEKYEVYLTHSICPDCAADRYGDLKTAIENTPLWLAKNINSASQEEIIRTIVEAAAMENGLETLRALRAGLEQVAAEIEE